MVLLFFTLNREDFSFVIHLDRQPRTSRRREAQTGSRARSGSRSERTLDAVEHSRTLMEWWPFLIFHRGGLRIKVINNTRSHPTTARSHPAGALVRRGALRSLCRARRRRARDRRPAQTRGTPAQRGHGAQWRKTRARVLREEPRCRFCGERLTEVDHIVERTSDHFQNLVTADDQSGWGRRKE